MRARAKNDYAICDPKALSRLLGRIVKELAEGKETTAAKIIGISQPTLNRLRNRKRATVSGRIGDLLTAVALKLHDGKAAARQLAEEAILNPGVARILDAYGDWEKKTLGRAGTLPRRWGQWFPRTKPEEPRGARYPFGASDLVEDLDWCLWRMREETPREFARFQRLIGERSAHTARMSALRIFEPLLHHHDSDFIERSPIELTPAEFKTFVRAGITREIIILNRQPAAQRAIQSQIDIGVRTGHWSGYPPVLTDRGKAALRGWAKQGVAADRSSVHRNVGREGSRRSAKESKA